MYITFEEYQNMGGSEKDMLAFSRLQTQAKQYIDRATFGRVKAMETPHNNVKMLSFELIEYLKKKGSVDTDKEVTSMSNNGVSVSYAKTTQADKDNDIFSLIRLYLGGLNDDNGAPLLFCGVVR